MPSLVEHARMTVEELLASRHRQWEQLLAATAVTVMVAVPMLVLAALTEAYLWPLLLRNLVA